ncbi:MAG: hypothetical protein HY897_06050, partial [Deltaproteobacteria bacterium]|nr:hypothetical protein [Deltaproteobacteria bacterium]
MTQPACEIFTIGFTQKSAETFFGLLKNAGVRLLVDITAVPMLSEQFQLVARHVVVLREALVRKCLRNRHFLEKVQAENLQDL